MLARLADVDKPRRPLVATTGAEVCAVSLRIRCGWAITVGIRSAHAIRPIRSSDKEALLRFHARLSPDARYRRYHGLKGDLTPAELRFLTETDEVTHVARIAIDVEGEIDAVARVVDGEIAVVVADGHRRAGLGHRVAVAALVAFRDQGDGGPVTAYVQADNGRALRLFQRLGARRRASAPGEPVALVIPG